MITFDLLGQILSIFDMLYQFMNETMLIENVSIWQFSIGMLIIGLVVKVIVNRPNFGGGSDRTPKKGGD